jgi:hypothetical protein
MYTYVSFYCFLSANALCSAIGIYKPDDVRPILQAYRGKDIPIEYSKKEAEAKEKHIEEWRHKKKGIAGGGFTLSGIFGTNNNDSVRQFEQLTATLLNNLTGSFLDSSDIS